VASIRQAVTTAPDLIISTGGISVGDHDQVPAALQALGATVHFRGVAMRPGKPVLFATLPNGCLYFGLPGNPVAAATVFWVASGGSLSSASSVTDANGVARVTFTSAVVGSFTVSAVIPETATRDFQIVLH